MNTTLYIHRTTAIHIPTLFRMSAISIFPSTVTYIGYILVYSSKNSERKIDRFGENSIVFIGLRLYDFQWVLYKISWIQSSEKLLNCFSYNVSLPFWMVYNNPQIEFDSIVLWISNCLNVNLLKNFQILQKKNETKTEKGFFFSFTMWCGFDCIYLQFAVTTIAHDLRLEKWS